MVEKANGEEERKKTLWKKKRNKQNAVGFATVNLVVVDVIKPVK